MRRLVFIVEGDTELIFVQHLIAPHLTRLGFPNQMHAQTITTNRKQHAKGGIGTYGKFKNEVTRTLAQGNVIVTTLIDFFRLPGDFPAYTQDSTRIGQIETAIHTEFENRPDFIPYIQRHESEALMFSSRQGFELVIDDHAKLQRIDQIIDQYPNPEDINNSPTTAPSKRMEQIFKYDKVGDGELIIGMLSIDEVISKCPRFAAWIEKLVVTLSYYNTR